TRVLPGLPWPGEGPVESRVRENLTHGSERGRGKRGGSRTGSDIRGHRPERTETEQPDATPTSWDHCHRARGLLYRRLYVVERRRSSAALPLSSFSRGVNPTV